MSATESGSGQSCRGGAVGAGQTVADLPDDLGAGSRTPQSRWTCRIAAPDRFGVETEIWASARSVR
jgi:hypothetical protein